MNFLDLRISGKGVPLDEITRNLGIIPKITYKDGDERSYKGKMVVYSEDCWIANVEIENIEDTEQQVNDFVNLIHAHADYIIALAQKHCINLHLTLYQECTQYYYHVSSKVMGQMSEMGISFGLTCMQLKGFYDGTVERQYFGENRQRGRD